MTKARRLRSLLEAGPLVRLVGAHDALSARLVERSGFEGVWASSLEISATYGLPDAGLLTMTEFLHAAYVMANATSIPVVADCDNGFGGERNVRRLVHEYERHGIAGICIEDKRIPKNNSLGGGSQYLEDAEVFAGKIDSAKDAQRDPNFVVIGRIEALIAGCGCDVALDRAHRYADAGADAIVIHSKAKTAEQIGEFMKGWRRPVPIVVIPTTYPDVTRKELTAMGVRVVIYANHGLRSSIRGMKEVLSELQASESIVAVDARIATVDEIFELQEERRWSEV